MTHFQMLVKVYRNMGNSADTSIIKAFDDMTGGAIKGLTPDRLKELVMGAKQAIGEI